MTTLTDKLSVIGWFLGLLGGLYFIDVIFGGSYLVNLLS